MATPKPPEVVLAEEQMTTTRRIIEGTWNCRECDQKGILGRHKVCPTCGAPREKGEAKFDFGATRADGSAVAASVTDAKVRELAEAGKDWMCAHCGSSNRGDHGRCAVCGAPRAEASAATGPAVVRGPATRAPEQRGRLGGLFAALFGTFGLAALAILVAMGVCVGAVLVAMPRTAEVDAHVIERTYVRERAVERLVERDHVGWREDVPAPASPPGSDLLAAGLGTMGACEAVPCWPRPPDGFALARVAGKSWTRTITAQPMVEHSGSGWRETAPMGFGSYPVGGTGGSPGVLGSPICQQREKVARQCRQVSSQVQCGTDHTCTVRDLGNGFAEEVCSDVPKYCTEFHEECDPAQFGDWCTWTELSWGPSRTATATGTTDAPYWPGFVAQPNEAVQRTEQYTLALEPLTAGAPSALALPDPMALAAPVVGAQVFVAGSTVNAVPKALVRSGTAFDCGAVIPRDTLTTRDRCAYTEWIWQREAPLSVRGAEQPPWPEVSRADTRVEDREWAEVEIAWQRDERTGSERTVVSVEEASRWPLGIATPVVVDGQARVVEWKGPRPTAFDPHLAPPLR